MAAKIHQPATVAKKPKAPAAVAQWDPTSAAPLAIFQKAPVRKTKVKKSVMKMTKKVMFVRSEQIMKMKLSTAIQRKTKPTSRPSVSCRLTYIQTMKS